MDRIQRPMRQTRPLNHSIREELERTAWSRDAIFAERMARRRARRLQRPGLLQWQDRALILISIILAALLLLRIETAQADEFWGLMLQSPEGPSRQLALDTRIEADVTGKLARVEITQRFSNTSPHWVEGVYRFPLPPGAAVDRLQIRVGSRVIEGEIRMRDEARRIYQHARETGRVASIVEKQRPNQYESRLANIGPGESIRITLGFLAHIEIEAHELSLNLPLTFTPRWTPTLTAATDGATVNVPLVPAATDTHGALELSVLLRSSTGFAAIESRNHDVDILPVAEGYRVQLAADSALPDRDFSLSWTPDMLQAPQSELLTWDGGDAVYAQLMLVPPLPAALQPRAREVVFVIDTSGSMHGTSLQQASAALAHGLEGLGANDRFNVIQFNSEAQMLFPESVPAHSGQLREAVAYVNGLRADGGTNMEPALIAALSLPEWPGLLRQVIFITDGAIGNEHDMLLVVAEGLGDARLFSVSIGSAPNAGFMRKAAEIGRGTHTRIAQLEEVETRMSVLWGQIRQPALSGICVEWDSDAEYYPEIIPDLYASQAIWLTARLPSQPREITLCGEFNGRPWEIRVKPRHSEGAEVLATLWARSKIEALEDSRIFGSDPEWVRTEITELALAHGLLTRHTSLVAVDKTPVRSPDEGLSTEQVPGLLPAGSTTTAVSFPATASGWATRVVLSLLTFAIALAMFLFSGAHPPWRQGEPVPAVDASRVS